MAQLLENPRARSRFRSRLLRWYDSHKRDLPWRDVDDPYQVWVSEVMLQQTRVDQMAPYFERFMSRFPSVKALATAPETDVLKAWEGLGYYSRARNLHRAARQLVDEEGGRLPRDHDALLSLPGIGEYTAAAISSIAFDAAHPVLDGNVTRVLCRLLHVVESPRTSAARTDLIAAGERLLARRRPGDFNQALMELGARVCTPTRPGCADCPVVAFCRAHAELDDPGQLPVKTAKAKRPHYHVTAGMIWKRGRLLIAQRPADGMLGGLWEFPGGKLEEGESLERCLQREIEEELDFEITVGEHLAQVDHGYSHFSITLHAFEARYLAGRPRALGCADLKWIRPSQLDDYPMPRADRRVLEWLKGGEGQERLPLSYTERKIRGC